MRRSILWILVLLFVTTAISYSFAQTIEVGSGPCVKQVVIREPKKEHLPLSRSLPFNSTPTAENIDSNRKSGAALPLF